MVLGVCVDLCCLWLGFFALILFLVCPGAASVILFVCVLYCCCVCFDSYVLDAWVCAGQVTLDLLVVS